LKLTTSFKNELSSQNEKQANKQITEPEKNGNSQNTNKAKNKSNKIICRENIGKQDKQQLKSKRKKANF
jgi:hypothetical protein